MAKGDFDQIVTLSVLDRLIDREPKNPTVEARLTRAQSVRLMKAAVKRDLEWLLNTRRIKEESVDAASELTHSLYNYGLPDLTNFGLHSSRDQNRLTWMLESTESVYEPRLMNPKVFMEPVEPGSKKLKFRIDGLLNMDPAPECVTFDTTLDLTSQSYVVKGEGGA